MDTKEFRQAVTQALETWRTANATTTDIVYPNAPVPDEAEITSPWLDVRISWVGGDFSTVGNRPRGRHRGSVIVNAYTREGEGTGDADDFADSLIELFRQLRIPGAVFSMPYRVSTGAALGWDRQGVLAPFTFDSA